MLINRVERGVNNNKKKNRSCCSGVSVSRCCGSAPRRSFIFTFTHREYPVDVIGDPPCNITTARFWNQTCTIIFPGTLIALWMATFCTLEITSYERLIRTYYQPETRWVRIQPVQADRRTRRNPSPPEESRHFKPDTISTITETLGAINTVGRYLVNMTRGGGEGYNKISEEVPSAIYTITKNVLGRNVTDTIAPLVREALPIIQDSPSDEENDDEDDDDDSPRSCTTPDGAAGYIMLIPERKLNLLHQNFQILQRSEWLSAAFAQFGEFTAVVMF